MYYWRRGDQSDREKRIEQKDGTDRGTIEIQSTYLTSYLVLVVNDYSMSSCCMSIYRAEVLSESCLLSHSRFDRSA